MNRRDGGFRVRALDKFEREVFLSGLECQSSSQCSGVQDVKAERLMFDIMFDEPQGWFGGTEAAQSELDECQRPIGVRSGEDRGSNASISVCAIRMS